MAGEIKLNNVSIATENAGTVTIAPNNVQFAANHAGIKTALNASGSAPVYACRAWVNFNGTGTVAIRDSGNVSSITDNGTGDYTVNFATAMPHSNYGIGINAAYGVGGSGRYASAPDGGTTTITTTQLRLNTCYDYNQNQDCAWVTISIFC